MRLTNIKGEFEREQWGKVFKKKKLTVRTNLPKIVVDERGVAATPE